MRGHRDTEAHKTEAEIIEHYEIEKELAARLRNANKSERRTLYTSLYDELYTRVPHHRLLVRKASETERNQSVENQMRLLDLFLHPHTVFMEVGAGDCSLSFHVADVVRKVHAIDVSNKITEASCVPDNFSLIISDGSSIPVPGESIDVAFSNQLMEHLHPDDSQEQLKNICDSLVPGGIYLCITPNRISGPHDISKYFDDVATGFHLREYTFYELEREFKAAGFRKILTYNKVLGRYIRTPNCIPIVVERFLLLLPASLRRKLARNDFIKRLINIRLVGVK